MLEEVTRPRESGSFIPRPTPTHTPMLALRDPGMASVTTRRPPGNSVRLITPPPATEAVLVRARNNGRDEAIGRV